MKSDKVVKNIKRNTRKRYSSEEKIRIVLEGLRGESMSKLKANKDIVLKNDEKC